MRAEFSKSRVEGADFVESELGLQARAWTRP
jgi:hypothetical protein